METNVNSQFIYSDKLRKAARESLLTSITNPRKVEDRKKLLTENPELKINIRGLPIKNIINFLAFKCSPNSSVARNEAIKGSDIDGGIVVVDYHDNKRELDFVNELRNQGFEAYHKDEIMEIKTKLENPDLPLDEDRKLTRILNHRQLSEINFVTLKEIDEGIGGNTTYKSAAEVYLGGDDVPLI